MNEGDIVANDSITKSNIKPMSLSNCITPCHTEKPSTTNNRHLSNASGSSPFLLKMGIDIFLPCEMTCGISGNQRLRSILSLKPIKIINN